jgi:hypothetical protein
MTGIASARSAVGGDPALLSRVSAVVREGALEGRLPVRESARACVGACALTAAELAARRAGPAVVPAVRVDDGAVATAFVSERHLRIDRRTPVAFAPLSRFWRTADGWVRTHANHPHHRARLLGASGVPAGEGAVAAVESALAERSAPEVEETVYTAGGLAVALRTPGVSAGRRRAAGADRAVLRGRQPVGAAGAGPDGALADERRRGRRHTGRGVRRGRALAGRDGQRARAAAVRPFARLLRGRATRLDTPAGALGDGRAALELSHGRT